MKIGFIKPTYPNEKRVALLPQHILNNKNTFIVEKDFGATMHINDEEYINKGCIIKERTEIFATCDYIFCLKLLQPQDYNLLRDGQVLIGWTHPTGSGKEFFQSVCQDKKTRVIDLDNIYPRLYYMDQVLNIDWLSKNFIWRNSYNAGIASVMHALLSFGNIPDSNTKVAVLACGSVSQGAYNYISKFNPDIRLFYRSTLDEFTRDIHEFDIIINGIEIDKSDSPIISFADQERIKKGCFIIDSAADAGNAIEGTRYTSIDNPVYQKNGIYYYEVNNAPSVLYKKSSHDISKAFFQHVYNRNEDDFKSLFSKL